MIPGKKYTPEDILRIGWRYRWTIIVPFVVLSSATFVVSHYLPNWYRSETLILVVPQRVPEAYVKSTVTTRIEERLQSISQQILSRTRLEPTIRDFNLYVEERRTGIMEDVVERMRRDIDVQIVKGDAFRVAYKGRDPRTVMRVTERLASLFIDESLRDREVLAEGTNQFLDAQLEEAKRQLIDHEQKLEAYRRRHDGELPSQVDSNLQSIRTAEVQLQTIAESLNRDRDQLTLADRQLADASITEATVVSTPVAPDSGVTAASPSQQLDAARASLANLELRFTQEHPDVIRLKRVVRELEQQADAEALRQPLSIVAAPASPAERGRVNRVRELQIVRQNLERQIAAKQEDEKRLRATIAQFQARVAAVPTRESELVELTRDYETLQKNYVSLLSKREDSKIAANLERRQIGEQFKILDPARLPEKPFSPNRILINVGGCFGALALGVALAALLEYRDTSLRSLADVSLVLALPVIGTVPEIVTASERASHRRRTLIISAATLTLTLAVAIVLAVWKLRA